MSLNAPRIVVAALVAGALLAATVTLARRARPSEPGESADRCPGSAVMQAPSLPEGALLQVQVFDQHDRASGYRVYGDGRYESRAPETGWAAGAPMTPEQMEAIRAAIRAAAPERLQARYEPARRTPDGDQATLRLEFALDSPARQVTVVRPCRVPEIDGFIQQMAEIFKRR